MFSFCNGVDIREAILVLRCKDVNHVYVSFIDYRIAFYCVHAWAYIETEVDDGDITAYLSVLLEAVSKSAN